MGIVALIWLLVHFAGRGNLRGGIGSSIGRVVEGHPDRPGVTFEDVGGQRHAKTELREALGFLQHLDAARRLGIRPLRGLLLSGPPGTGKTLLAKAAANWTGAAFLAASGSEFIEMYAGVGASRVRGLFSKARKRARATGRHSAILFIDELEVLAGRRGRHSSHLEYDQTVNQLLVEMDGMEADADGVVVLVIGATNRLDLIDEALLRPGRFDRVVHVPLPGREGRAQILAIHTADKPLAPDVDVEALARETFGFSGAQLESVANEAAILALREEKARIERRHFAEAVEKVMLGERLERRPDADELLAVAIHELGHAVVGETLVPGSVGAVTVTPRGEALGYVRNRPETDRHLEREQELRDRLAVALGGTVAEHVCLGSRSTGARRDLEQARQLARMLVEAGMSALGPLGAAEAPSERLHQVLSQLMAREEKRAETIVREQSALIHRLAAILVERERLEGDELRRYLAAEDAARPGNAVTAGSGGGATA